MTQTVTNPLVQMACERRTGTTRIRPCPAFRLRRPRLLTNSRRFFRFWKKKKSREGRREGDRERGGGGEGRRGVVKTVRFVSPVSSLVGERERERRERGRRVLCNSMGDVVRGYPRPGLDAGEAGRGKDYRYRHATRAPAAQGE